jgi:hypothetical protein
MDYSNELEWFRVYGEYISENYPHVNNEACEYVDNTLERNNIVPNAEWSKKSFEQFWLAYPKKVGKKQTATQWRKINADNSLFKKIMLALETQKREKELARRDNTWTPEFQDPVRWLRNERWEDQSEEQPKVIYKKPNIKERDER